MGFFVLQTAHLWITLNLKIWSLGGRNPFRFTTMLAQTEKSKMEPGQERRMMRRFDMRLPASVRIRELGPDPFVTETQNVSARGVFFYLDKPVSEGSHIEVTMTFPPHITLTDPVRVRFMARVVRVNPPLRAERVGVAAIIEEYEFLRTYPDSTAVSQ